MVEIQEVKTKKQQKLFLQYPLDLYRDNPCFVPPLWGDEKKIFRSDYVYHDTCDSVFYLALREGEVVGRISGILQKAANEKHNEKRVRFTRFDAIDDIEVAKALFGAVENWAREKGMDTVCGPLGYSDLEREGLLIEGFDQLSTFEEQYNAPYYATLIEACGYGKEVDWTESKINAPSDEDVEKMRDLSRMILKRYNLKLATAKNTRAFLKQYADGIFDLLDRSYDHLYGTVPFSDGMKKMTLDNFALIVNMKHLVAILNEKDEIVCFGVCMPSIAKAVQKSRGHLTPTGLCRVLKAIRKPEIIDLALIGVDPEYANRGISAVISAGLMEMLRNPAISYAETNLNLEDNFAIQNQWKRFRAVRHKRRRSYVKTIVE